MLCRPDGQEGVQSACRLSFASCSFPSLRLRSSSAGAPNLTVLSASGRAAMPPMIVPAPQHGLHKKEERRRRRPLLLPSAFCIAMLVSCSALICSGVYFCRLRQLARDAWPGTASTRAGRMLCLRAKELSTYHFSLVVLRRDLDLDGI